MPKAYCACFAEVGSIPVSMESVGSVGIASFQTAFVLDCMILCWVPVGPQRFHAHLMQNGPFLLPLCVSCCPGLASRQNGEWRINKILLGLLFQL